MASTTKQADISQLRKQAEARIKQHMVQARKLPSKDLREIVEELHTHQIELELQNEELRRAQRELDEAKTRYAELYESAPVGYFTSDAHGIVKMVNRTGAGMLGFDKNRLISVPFIRFIAKEDRTTFTRHLRDVQSTRRKQTCELRLLRPDKSTLSVELQTIVTEDGPGDGLECRTTMIDISARREAEELSRGLNKHLELLNRELDAERSRWQGVVEGIADEVWACDTEGRMSLVNLPDVTAMGLKAFKHRSVEEVLHDVEILNPDGTPRTPEQTPLLRSLKGEVVRGEELMRHRGTGRVRWRHYSSAPLHDASGAITGAVAIVRDITDLKEIEENLRASEARLNAIASTALDAVVLIDNDGNVSFWNEAATKMFGYSEAEIKGKYLHNFIMPGRHAEAYKTGFETFKVTGKGPVVGVVYETEAKRKDGSEFPVELSLSALQLKGAWCAVGIVRDITQRKQAEEVLKKTMDELARSNRELDHFASVVSHDLQSPLRTISGFTNLLVEHYEGKLDEKADQYIAFILKAAKRMSVLVHDLHVYSRVGTGEKLHQPVETAAALASALENLGRAIEETGAIISGDALPRVAGDPTQLMQLFQNLIGNAITFRKKEAVPAIRISAELTGDFWTFSVRDNGIGIEPRFYERIFCMFQRLHTEDEYPGTGLGLALGKKIVELHGGRMWVESKPGEGSTFYFTLPAA